MMTYPLTYISIFKNNSHEMFIIVRSRPRLEVLEAAQHVGRTHPTGGVFDPVNAGISPMGIQWDLRVPSGYDIHSSPWKDPPCYRI